MFVAFPGFPYSTRPQCRMLSQTFGNAEKFPGHFGCEATKEDEHLGTTEANLCSFDIWGCRFSGPPSSDNWGPWLFAVCKGRNFAQLYIYIGIIVSHFKDSYKTISINGFCEKWKVQSPIGSVGFACPYHPSPVLVGRHLAGIQYFS